MAMALQGMSATVSNRSCVLDVYTGSSVWFFGKKHEACGPVSHAIPSLFEYRLSLTIGTTTSLSGHRFQLSITISAKKFKQITLFSDTLLTGCTIKFRETGLL